jgi:hypothetical protein
MNMRKIVLIIIPLILLVVAVTMVMKGGVSTFNKEETTKPVADPLDVVLDFYGEWIDFIKSTSTNPYQSELMNNPVLTESVKQRLLEDKGNGSDLDPFFCRMNTPERIGGKVLYSLENSAEIIIKDRRASSTEPFSQAVVSMEVKDGVWQITKIVCNRGEIAPESEFSFEKDGYLIKSMQAPYVSGQWHLVYAEDGTMGYVAPLIFTASSTCTTQEGNTSTCTPDSITEGTAARVKAHMTEEGATVAVLELK